MKLEQYQRTAAERRLERILVMDDELMVRETCRLLLQHLGYEVVVATEGQAAVDFYLRAKEAGKPFDVVFLDLTVNGGMGGKEASAILRARDPKARMVVMSGYSENDIMLHYVYHGFKGVLAKPFDRDTLENVVRYALES